MASPIHGSMTHNMKRVINYIFEYFCCCHNDSLRKCRVLGQFESVSFVSLLTYSCHLLKDFYLYFQHLESIYKEAEGDKIRKNIWSKDLITNSIEYPRAILEPNFQRHMFTVILFHLKTSFCAKYTKTDRTIDLSKKMKNLHQSKGLWTKFIRDFIFRHWTYITTLKTTKAFNGEAAATAFF